MIKPDKSIKLWSEFLLDPLKFQGQFTFRAADQMVDNVPRYSGISASEGKFDVSRFYCLTTQLINK